MTKIRSLLFREMRVSRKNTIVSLILLAAIGGFYLFAMYVMNQESLTDGDLMKSMILMSSAVMAMICSISGLTQSELSFKKDIGVNWLRYSYTLPVSPCERAIVLVLFRNALILSMMMIALAFNAIYCHISEVQFSVVHVTVYLMVYAGGLIAAILSDLFTLTARSTDEHQMRQQRLGLTMLFICIAAAAVFYDKINVYMTEGSIPVDIIYDSINSSWLIWLIPLIILLIFADYLVIKNRLENAFSEFSVKKKAEKTTAITDAHDYPTGFFYKELKQNRLQIVLVAVTPILVTALSYGMMFSISLTENIPLKAVMADSEYILVHYLCIGLSVYVGSSFVANVFSGDENKLWAFFTASTPKGVKRYMYNKYVLCFALTGIFMVMSIFSESIYDTIGFIVTGKESVSIVSIYIVIFYALLFIIAIDIPFMVRFGQKRGSVIKTIAMLVISTAAVIIFSNLSFEHKDNLMKAITSLWNGEEDSALMLIAGALPLICLGAYLLSFTISCKLFMKGVKGYDK